MCVELDPAAAEPFGFRISADENKQVPHLVLVSVPVRLSRHEMEASLPAASPELANRPLIREQAFNEALDPDSWGGSAATRFISTANSNGRWPCCCASKTCGRGPSRADPFRKTKGGGHVRRRNRRPSHPRVQRRKIAGASPERRSRSHGSSAADDPAQLELQDRRN
jgi:hypothetical protein